MSYVTITTPTNTTVEELFTLGVSTSRGTENIGQFGSGVVMSVLTWLRQYGKSPEFRVNGERVTFRTETRQKSDGNFYDAVLMTRKPDGGRAKTSEMSISLEYGTSDWTDVGMSMREWISNALDQGAELTNCIRTTSKPTADDGVSVCIPMTPEVKSYLENLGSYFLHGKADQHSKTLPKSGDKMRVYRRGVFIREMNDDSLFDYNLDFDITENRNGSSDSMERLIRNLVQGRGYHNVEYYKQVWEAILSGKQVFEKTAIQYSWDRLTGDWVQILTNETRKVYPIGTAILGKMDTEGLPIADDWYHEVIRINPNLDGLSSGSARNGFVGESVTEGPVFDLMVRLTNIVRACGLENGKDSLPNLEVYRTADGHEPKMRGFYDKNTDTIGIYHGNRNDANVMLEEIAHRHSGHKDETRNFQDYLIALAVRFIGDTEL